MDWEPQAERAAIAETLLASAARLLRARSELEVIQGVCESLCGAGRHMRLCWTWFGPRDTSELRPQVAAGPGRAYAESIRIPRNLLTELGPAFRVLAGDRSESFAVSRWSLYGPWRQVSREHGVRSVLAVPLQTDLPDMAGLFVLYADREDYFREVGESLFEALGALFSSVLGTAAERVALEQAIHQDALTGTLNRRALPLVERRVARRSLFDPKAFVLMIDLDHFKRINDELGHHAGDEVLQRVAATMRRVLRRGDEVLRWGGEEFLVCLKDTSLNDALTVAEKLRRAIEAEAGPTPVTASIGMAEVMPNRALADSVARADEALFQAKAAGRNRVQLMP
jgi:diguanylate cyclase (GGDEF)-like protein